MPILKTTVMDPGEGGLKLISSLNSVNHVTTVVSRVDETESREPFNATINANTILSGPFSDGEWQATTTAYKTADQSQPLEVVVKTFTFPL